MDSEEKKKRGSKNNYNDCDNNNNREKKKVDNISWSDLPKPRDTITKAIMRDLLYSRFQGWNNSQAENHEDIHS